MSNSNFSIGCANGTDALILALKSLNLKKNHEVIIPGMTYISTGLCVTLNNLKLVFADVDDDCATGDLGWTSNGDTDYDTDGCQDSTDEDLDDDNDGQEDADDDCQTGNLGWTSDDTTDYDCLLYTSDAADE